MTLTYPFTEAEAKRAADEWGCNCGPSALAFALQVKLEAVRGAIPGFDEKRYTSPTMMKAAILNMGFDMKPMFVKPPSRDGMFQRVVSLVRIQWTGPWTAAGANPRWAYRQTHWIATWLAVDGSSQLFDVNGGARSLASWEELVVPALTALYNRADGGWYPTHVWRLFTKGAA